MSTNATTPQNPPPPADGKTGQTQPKSGSPTQPTPSSPRPVDDWKPDKSND